MMPAATRRPAILAAVLLALVVGPAIAQPVRYVRITGNNSNSGTTPANAWRTLDRAADGVPPGTTVYVGAGVYNEAVTPSSLGNAARPIRFIADRDGSRTGDAGEVVVSRSGTVFAFTASGAHWEISGFTIDARGSGHAVLMSAASNLRLVNCTLRNSGPTAAVIHVTGSGVVSADRVSISAGFNALNLHRGRAAITNSVITNIQGDAFYLQRDADRFELIGSTVSGVGDDAVDANGGASFIHNTILHDIGDDALARRESARITHTHNLYHDIRGTTFSGTVKHASEIEADPLFASSSTLRLSVESPALNAGAVASAWPASDLAGVARPAGDGWDIGAYERADGGTPPGPVLHLALDEVVGPAAPDASGRGHHGRLAPGAAWDPRGQYGTALAFNGVSGRVEVPDHDDFRLNAEENYSLSAWVYVSAVGSGRERGVITRDAGADGMWGIWLDSSDRWVAGGTTRLTGPIANEGWSHIAVVQDGLGGSRTLFVNGSRIATGASSAAMGEATVLLGNSRTGAAFTGRIDDVRLWRRTLDDAEVLALAAPPTYFVRSSGSNGRDGRSPATAWRTIEHALNLAPPGATVYVGAGVYTGGVTVRQQSTRDQRTRVLADRTGAFTGDAGEVVIRGADSIIVFDAASHVEFRGFTVEGGPGGGAMLTLQRGSAGVGLFECVINGRGASRGIDIRNDSALILGGSDVSGADTVAVLAEQGSLHAIASVFRNSGDGMSITRASHAVLNACRFVDNTIRGVIVEGSVRLSNAVVADNGRNGVVLRVGGDLTAWHLTVRNNGRFQLRMHGGTLTLRNSIFESSGNDVAYHTGGSVDEQRNIFWNGSDDGLRGMGRGASSLAIDPELDPAHRPADRSPAIDAGADSSAWLVGDIEGSLRQQGSASDLGAFEGGGGEIPLFVDVTAETGFGVIGSDSHHWASGWHWGDMDGDGDLDALLTGNVSASYFRNLDGASGFAVAPFGSGGRPRGGALGDFDNDGDLDFVHVDARLFLNDGRGGLLDAGASGISGLTNTEGAAAIDFDRDGWLDVAMFAENGNWILRNTGEDPVRFEPTLDAALGFHVPGAYGNGDYMSTADVNGDGVTDIFYHYNGGILFMSQPDGAPARAIRLGVVTGNEVKFGSAWGDYDNDGDMDLFVCGYEDGRRGYLFRNDGGVMTEVALAAGIDNAARQLSACWGDYDNDGNLDLYITTGADQPNVLYQNQGDGTFIAVDLGAAINVPGHDAQFVDYDNDGDLDLVIACERQGTRLLRNQTNGNAFLRVRVVGRGAGGTNTFGVGVRVQLLSPAGRLLQTREVGGARGFAGGGSMWVHFGGVDPAADYIVRAHFVTGPVDVLVRPAETSTSFRGMSVRQLLTIEESRLRRFDMVRWAEVAPGEE